jgi:hypothetical protein
VGASGTRYGPLVPARRRLAAWIVTGPLGHLYGGVADWTTLLARYAWARARGRDPDWY